MAGYTVLKAAFVAVLLGCQDSTAQDIVFADSSHPGYEPVVNRRVEVMPPRVSVRSRNRPVCTASNDPTLADGSAPCVQDQDYNDNVRNLVSQLLSQTRSVNEIVSDPVLRVILNDTLTTFNPIEPSTRFGGFRESPVCGAQEELIFPQRAKTPKDDWVFVVNQPDVKQALRVEKCIGEGQPCRFGTTTRDVSTVCRQKYVYRRMLVLGSNNIEPEEVLMPSCCVCYSRRENFDVATRIIINENGNDPGAASGQPSPANQPGVINQPNTVNQPNVNNQPNPANQPNVNNQPNPVNQPVPGLNLAFPQSLHTSALRGGNVAHRVDFIHSPVRRGTSMAQRPFPFQQMRYL